MKKNWLIKKRVGNFIGLVTDCFDGKHPEFSMLTTEEFLCDDKIFLTKIVKSIISKKMKYYDHFLFFGSDNNLKDIYAFVIEDPHDENRFRLVKTRRPYYTESLKIEI